MSVHFCNYRLSFMIWIVKVVNTCWMLVQKLFALIEYVQSKIQLSKYLLFFRPVWKYFHIDKSNSYIFYPLRFWNQGVAQSLLNHIGDRIQLSRCMFFFLGKWQLKPITDDWGKNLMGGWWQTFEAYNFRMSRSNVKYMNNFQNMWSISILVTSLRSYHATSYIV